MSFSGLGGIDISVLERDLVGRRQDWLVEEDIGDAQREAVSLADVFGGGVWVPIEEDLGANVSYALS
ncbi:hypothetical protein IG631_10743 [Alternaria alternata]|nr:hypothetical protein IG631_10743 [Alternaria alternata]